MKKAFILAAGVITTMALMFSVGVNFVQTAERIMDKDMTMKEADMMTEKSQKMMDKGKMMKEGDLM